MPTSPDVIVVGGGVIGCSIAFHLAKAGVKTLVLEKGRLGAQSSAAGSGILEVAPGDHPFERLGRESLALLYQLVGELRETGGVDVELVQCGGLELALREDEEQELRRKVVRSNELGSNDQWLDRQAVHHLEPGLSAAVLGGIYEPAVCRVNNQRLTESFAKAAIPLGAEFRQGAEVTGLIRRGHLISGVHLHDRDIPADHVVMAAGAWSSIIAGWARIRLPVRPVKGQNVNLQPAAVGIKTAVRGSGWYLIPRNDGSVMAGVTIEEVGFDARVTADGVATILAAATALVPALKDAALNWTIAGLRPGSPDDMPLLGPVPGWDGLTVASGHYRHGNLLSPITGRLIANQLTGRLTSEDATLLATFKPDRFTL